MNKLRTTEEHRELVDKFGIGPAIQFGVSNLLIATPGVVIREARSLDDKAVAFYAANKDDCSRYVKIVLSFEEEDFETKGGEVRREEL